MYYTMIRNLLLSLAFLGSVAAVSGQPPLSKRDQKKLEAWEQELEAEKKYTSIISMAETAFEEGRYVDARMLYSEGIEYNEENRAWLIAKVNDLDILLARNAARQIDSVSLVSKKGVQRIEVEEVSPDIAIREVNVEMQPVTSGDLPDSSSQVLAPEEDGTSGTSELRPEQKEQPAKASIPEKEAPKAVEEPDQKALYDDFPEGYTRDVFTFPDHEVTRIVVKDGIDTIVYKRVTHRWGGEFCFKDDVSISKRIWMEEVEQYRKRFGVQSGE